MEKGLDLLRLEAQVRAIMEELGVDREAAALLAAVRNGVALVDDVDIAPGPDKPDEDAGVERGRGHGTPVALARRGRSGPCNEGT